MLGVEYNTCSEKQLILESQNEVLQIDFFNVIFYDESSRLKTCEYLKEAEKIELEEEPYAKDAYYIYVDGKLLQEIIIDSQLGKKNVDYVEYKYDLEEKEIFTMTHMNQPIRTNRSFFILGIVLLGICLSFIIAYGLKS